MYGVLSKKQIIEYKDYITIEGKLNISNFAYDTLKALEKGSSKSFIGTKDVALVDGYPRFISYDIFNKDTYFMELHSKSQIFIPYLSIAFLPDRITFNTNDRFEKVKFGIYPQKRYNNINIKFNNIHFSTFNINGELNQFDYNLVPLLTYKSQNNEEYIKPINLTIEDYLYKVEEINWWVDKEKGIMFPDKILFTNIPYLKRNNDKSSRYDFISENSTIYEFIRKYFIPNIFQKEYIDIRKILSTDLNRYLLSRSEKLIDEAKEKYTEKLEALIKEIDKEKIDKIFRSKQKILEKLSNEEYEKIKNDINTNLDERTKMIEKHVDETLDKHEKLITKSEAKLETKLDEYTKLVKDKELLFTHLQDELNNIASKAFEEKVKPLMDEYSIDIDKIKKDFNIKVNELVASYYEEFKTKIDNEISSIDRKQKEIDELNNYLNDEYNKLDEIKEEFLSSIEDEIEKAKESKEKLVDEVIKEAILKLEKINPIKQVNININNVKTNSIKDMFHKDFEAILRLVSINIPVFLVGPAGCGKNVILKQCAEALNKKFYYQNDANEDHKLLGFVDANGIYHQTPFYKAFNEGGLLMLDEMDNANASVLLKLNSAIGSGNDFYMTFPNGETLSAHKDFQVVAAANTFGRGETTVYCGRNQLDGATLDRYFIYNLDYDKELERALVTNKDILDLYWEVRDIIISNDIAHTVSTRGILNMDKIISSGIIGKGTFTIGDAFEGTLIKGLDKDELNIIVSRIKTNDYYAKEFINYLKTKYNVSKDSFDETNSWQKRKAYERY